MARNHNNKTLQDQVMSFFCGLIKSKTSNNNNNNGNNQQQQFSAIPQTSNGQELQPYNNNNSNNNNNNNHHQQQSKSINNNLNGNGNTNPNQIVTRKFRVPGSFHGRIIGQGGQTIKQLQQEFNVRLSVPQRDSGDDQVVIVGPSSNVENACVRLFEVLNFKPEEITNNSNNNNQYIASNNNHQQVFNQQQHQQQSIQSNQQQQQQNIPQFSSSPISEMIWFPESSSFDKFIGYLRQTKHSIDVCVYTISDDRVSRVLTDLHHKGIQVRIITEKDTIRDLGNDAVSLAKIGIPVKVDASPALCHHKFAVCDQSFVLSGSFNWSRAAATSNQENMLATNDMKLVQQFVNQFQKLWQLPQMESLQPEW